MDNLKAVTVNSKSKCSDVSITRVDYNQFKCGNCFFTSLDTASIGQSLSQALFPHLHLSLIFRLSEALETSASLFFSLVVHHQMCNIFVSGESF